MSMRFLEFYDMGRVQAHVPIDMYATRTAYKTCIRVCQGA